MIGFDDFLDGYLQTEIDEIPNINTKNNLNAKDYTDENDLNQRNFDFDVKSDSPILEIESSFELEEVVISKVSSPELYHDVLEFEFGQYEMVDLVLIEPEISSAFVACEIDNQINSVKDIQLKEMCKICKCISKEHDGDPDFWLICYGCGEAFHRKCLTERLKRIKCEPPIIFRNRITDAKDEPKYSHAPWYCNNCVKCSCCPEIDAELPVSSYIQNALLKDSFVACRHCGKVSCLSCYNAESFNTNSWHQLSRFENLQNYSCPGCLQCINCGLSAAVPKDPFSTKNRRRSSICAQMLQQALIKTPSVTLYNDSTLCRPCYLSNQMCATCPRCKQIYHSLRDHYDFGETPFNSDFSLCPMIMCDDCGSWTHCQCEGISNEEYERLGIDKNAKFNCFDCRKSKKRPKATEIKPNSNISAQQGNIISIERNRIIFVYWSFDETWKRKLYELTFKLTVKNVPMFTLKSLKSSKFCIESYSLDSLSKKFTEIFQKSSSKALKCVNSQCLLNPMTLLTILETSKVNYSKEFCSYLREEIRENDKLSCARTQSLYDVKHAHVKSAIPKKTSISTHSLDPPGSSSPNISVSGCKMSLKYLYMQYSQSVRSDSSCSTIDSTSQGLALRRSSIAGFGLFATKQFQKNALIIEYCGEMLTGDDLVDKRDAHYNALGKRYQQSCYLFRLDELKVLDATHKGNLSRFINHSCDPNCYSRVVQIDEAKKLLIFASKIIEAGDEILYDYKFPDEEQKIPCLCRSEKCRKWMN